jgi:cardiolipin synthase
MSIADLLKQKSNEENVKVHVLFDSLANLFGGASGTSVPITQTYKTPATIKKYLKKDSKIKVRSAKNPFGTFDHVKTLIFDEKISYLGGMNIGKEYRYAWHDMMIKVEGPASKEMHNEFRKAWFGAGPYGDFGKLGITLDNRQPKNLINLDDYNNLDEMIDIRILHTKAGIRQILKAKLAAIRNAKKYIYIENPYLSDIRMVKGLIKARQRGVDVRVIFPGKNNIGLMSKSNIVNANKLIKNGVRVFIYPGMTHIKAGIFDGWATVGSANYNNLSLALSQELNISFDDKKTVAKLKKKLFKRDFAISKELTEALPATWTDRASKRLANYF